MIAIKKFTVVPAIPDSLADLRKLAHNFWWSWNYDAVTLFNRLDRHLWGRVNHNPVRLLAELPQAKLEQASKDPAYLAHLDRVMTSLSKYMHAPTWFQATYPAYTGNLIAYFSMEFGLHECLPIYSGGLGGLAGDHMKSASDLGLPLVGIGLLYHQGYFQQFLSNDGWQFEDYPDIDVHHLPATPVCAGDGRPLVVSFKVGERTVSAHVYEVVVGRVKIFLLDTTIATNHPDDRDITTRLYGGDQEMRIRQEITLGFGGSRVLRALGLNPDVFHMNEGHSAFLALDRIGQLVEDEGLSVAAARQAVAGSTIFTTHTPVPAGIDTFPQGLVEKYLGPYAKWLGISIGELMTWGQANGAEEPEEAVEQVDETFSMATLALNLSRQSNGVSQVHGKVAREMWRNNWPGVPVDEVPITSVTNGVHVRSWISSDVERLFERYLGPEWVANPDDSALWDRVADIPDAELWRAHERRRERLVVEVRAHLKAQFLKRGASPTQVAETEELLNPEALTIGFARRFAPYKRATLLLRDKQRLVDILTKTDRPVQFVFAGKAHPRDNMGKELIKTLVQFARDDRVRRRFAFIENYNMGIARFLVQGVDLWMNTPMKPLEASGTSGMKVTPNGGINFSVLDGWWSEAYDGSNGWAIGDDRVYDNPDYQDFVESESIYDILEREVIPEFYDRGSDGLPRRWLTRMKASMRTCTARFSSFRMVREYVERLYMPALRSGLYLRERDYAAARSLAEWKQRIAKSWDDVQIKSFDCSEDREHTVGSAITVTARVVLGDLGPNEVAVQLYHGPMPTNGTIEHGDVVNMKCGEKKVDGVYTFVGDVPCTRSGQLGFAVRVLPNHPDISGHYDMHLIKWA